MKSKKLRRRALLTSVMSLVLCCAMLVGTTFAWFTDSVTSANNIIKSGNLDVELYYQVEGQTDWTKVTKESNIFMKDALWEPGHTEVVKLKVVNEGTLALKYQLGVNIASETGSVNKDGKDFKLSEYIKFGIVDGAQTYTREQAVAEVERTANALNVVYNSGTIQLPAKNEGNTGEKIVTMVVYMPTTVGNEANHAKDAAVPTIHLGINLFATQVENESDSFGDDYDEGAWAKGFKVYDGNDLQDAIDAGEPNIVLMDDIPVTEPIVIPAPATTTYALRSKGITINLNGKTLSTDGGNAIYNEGNLTLTGKGKISSVSNYAIRVQRGSLLIDSNDIEVTSDFGAISVFNGADVTINGGSYSNKGYQNKTSHCIYLGGYGTININGGTFASGYSNGGIDTICGYGWSNDAGEKAVININGGTFYPSELEGAYYFISNYAGSWTEININGGVFHKYDPSKIGGTKLGEGYQAISNGNGTYTVIPVVADATLTATAHAGIYQDQAKAKTYYVFDKTGLMNLNALFADTLPNEASVNIINLGADIDLSGEDWKPIESMWVTFNGNGHTIRNLTAGMDAAGRRSGFWSYAGAVTINDLTLENVTVNGSQAGVFAGGAEALKINNCFLKGTNTVNFVAGVESWNGIGAITGVTVNSNINVTIAEGASVTLNRGEMQTAVGCTYIDDLTGHIMANSGTVTNNGTVTANGIISWVASNNAELKTAVESGAMKVLLADGEYEMPSSNTTGTVNISGTKETVLDVTLGAYMDNADGVTIEGVTIKTSTGKANGNGSDYAALYAKNVTYVNCTFVGPMRVGRDGAKFVNCTFTELGNDYIWTYGNDVTFEGCTFNTAGKAILIYSDGGSEVSQVAVKNCTFNSTQGAKAGAIANQNCAAIEIHNYGNGVNLTTSGNTCDSNFSGEWRIKTYETGKPQVFVNGTEYTTIAIDGKTMTIDGDRNVTVNP